MTPATDRDNYEESDVLGGRVLTCRHCRQSGVVGSEAVPHARSCRIAPNRLVGPGAVFLPGTVHTKFICSWTKVGKGDAAVWLVTGPEAVLRPGGYVTVQRAGRAPEQVYVAPGRLDGKRWLADRAPAPPGADARVLGSTDPRTGIQHRG